ncbi:hypothetical protein [Chryseobacterium sp. R2A-55]|uniref:hypothetical protein n=1 Tax=Chryseobacterium sp. R2A-55 TaxID=2744445 RepID=UPI001F295BFF|nr:hypothetical protein [Chryseobacterium sp. R2A-55]
MKNISFYAVIALLLMLVSCVVKVPMNEEYMKKPSRVGLFVNVSEPQKYREGSQGLLDLALTSGDKYQPVLNLAKKQLDPKQKLIDMYSDILRSKGKEVVIIDEKFDPKNIQKFKDEKAEGKKYSNIDFRPLKDKYQIDEVAFVNLNWGLMISYYSMIETGRAGYAYFDNRLVNLSDNSLYFANDNMKTIMIKGKWDGAPNYENAISKISETLNQAIEVEKNLYK